MKRNCPSVARAICETVENTSAINPKLARLHIRLCVNRMSIYQQQTVFYKLMKKVVRNEGNRQDTKLVQL